mgnify:CR=1 FL=1
MWDRKANCLVDAKARYLVLSELCGIESLIKKIAGVIRDEVLSELCGIESFGILKISRISLLVLSELCGIESQL